MLGSTLTRGNIYFYMEYVFLLSNYMEYISYISCALTLRRLAVLLSSTRRPDLLLSHRE